MNWTLVSVLVAVAIAAVKTWIDFQIKFAATREDAAKKIKQLALNLANLFASGLAVFLLVQQVTSPAPVTRLAAFQIAVAVAGLVAILLTTLFSSILRGMADITRRHLDVTEDGFNRVYTTLGKHVETTGDIVHALANLSGPRGPKEKE